MDWATPHASEEIVNKARANKKVDFLPKISLRRAKIIKNPQVLSAKYAKLTTDDYQPVYVKRYAVTIQLDLS